LTPLHVRVTILHHIKQPPIKEKIIGIQTELELLKQALIERPDFERDKKSWVAVKTSAKKIRKSLYRREYRKK